MFLVDLENQRKFHRDLVWALSYGDWIVTKEKLAFMENPAVTLGDSKGTARLPLLLAFELTSERSTMSCKRERVQLKLV